MIVGFWDVPVFSFINDIRIFLSFFSYNRECRKKHLDTALQRFPISDLESEIHELNSEILGVARVEFSNLLVQKNKADRLNDFIQGLKKKLSFFERKYKCELDDAHKKKDDLYKQKQALHDEIKILDGLLQEAYSDKDDAYERVNDAQSDIDGWHSASKRTPLLFGKGGKKIPEHSLFFMSHGDLAGYKRYRDAAYDDVNSAKSSISYYKSQKQSLHGRINEFKNDIHDLKAQIHSIKQDRQRMFDLKNQGYTEESLRKGISINIEHYNDEKKKQDEIQKQKTAFIESLSEERGLNNLKLLLENMMKDKNEFIESFDSEECLLARKAEYRKQWFENRGKTE